VQRLELNRLGALKVGVLCSRRIGQNHRQAGWYRSFHDKGLRLSFWATIGQSPRSLPRSGHIVALCCSSDFGFDADGGDMASPPSFRMSAHLLTFFNQGTRPLCYPRSPPHPNGISCLTIHLLRLTPLGVPAFQDSSSLNEPWPGHTPPRSWAYSPSVWATTGRMFLQFVMASY